MCFGGDTTIVQPQQQSYGSSMRESLGAQIDLAPQLYQAEASQQYGRPAYAQLETDVLRDTLLGKDQFIPQAGQEAAYEAASAVQPTETRKATEAELIGDLFDSGGTAEGWEWVGGSREAAGGMLQRTGGGGGQGVLGGTAEAATYTAPRPSTAFDVGTEPERWEAYVNLNPDLKEGFARDGTGRSISQFGKAHYDAYGKEEAARPGSSRFIPEIGKTYDSATGTEWTPQVTEGTLARDQGLLSLLGGEGTRTYGTGGVVQGDPIFDPETGMPQIDEFGQVITQTTPETEERRAGFTTDPTTGKEVFMGLAEYGSDIAQQSASRQRAADIGDVQKYGRMASEAIKAADPLSAQLIGTMGEQAQTELKAGGDLTTRERERAIQDARMGWEARGRVRDPGAVVSELENLETARRAREAQRRGFATQTMQASRAMTADPFMAILGRPSGASQQIATGAAGGAQYGLDAGPSQYSPESGLSYMLGQQTNQSNLAAAQAAANATRQAGMAQGIGSAIGGAASAIPWCWIAREVYGESNPKWKRFRSWLLNKAPEWFREWYLDHGEAVAEWLKDKPELKSRLRIFMDSKLEA